MTTTHGEIPGGGIPDGWVFVAGPIAHPVSGTPGLTLIRHRRTGNYAFWGRDVMLPCSREWARGIESEDSRPTGGSG